MARPNDLSHLTDTPTYRFLERGTAEVEIMLDQRQTGIYFLKDPVYWWKLADGRLHMCKTFEPTTFPRSHGNRAGGIPCKFSQREHTPAMEGFVRAFELGRVDGPPRLLARLIMEIGAFNACIDKGTIQIHESMQTVLFMC